MAKRKKTKDVWEGNKTHLNSLSKTLEMVYKVGNLTDGAINNILNYKIFELNDDVAIKLIRETEPMIEAKRIPYPKIFINVEIRLKFGDDISIVVYGIFVEELDDPCFQGMPNTHISEDVLKIIGDGKVFRFRFQEGIIIDDIPMAYKINVGGELVIPNSVIFTNLATILLHKADVYAELYEDSFSSEESPIDEKHKFIVDALQQKVISTVIGFTMNFINFIDEPDVEIIDINRKIGKNIPRFKSKTIPSNVVEVRGKLREYVNKMRKGENIHYSHRFWVRGHWRELKSDKYVNAQGKRVWIKPYVKGSGILVNKIYQVEE